MKLSGWQLFWIVVTLEIIGTLWVAITPTFEISKQDAWISMLVAGIVGVAATFLVVHVSLLHPNQTLTGFSQTLLGKWFGRIIVLPYFIAWYSLDATLLRSYGDFNKLLLLDKTPVWIIMLFVVALITYLTYSGGITGIGRFSEITGPILFLSVIISIFLNIGNVKWDQLLPVYSDSGWLTIVKGAMTPASYFGELFLLMAIVSFMHIPHKAYSRSLLGVGVTAFLLVITTIMTILVFGPNVSAKLTEPEFMLIRSINILEFIQNVDIFNISIWYFGVIAKLSLYLFIVSYEMAQWLKLGNWRKTIWINALVIFILALLIPNQSMILQYNNFWKNVIFPICCVGIPLLLWIITMVKNKSVKL